MARLSPDFSRLALNYDDPEMDGARRRLDVERRVYAAARGMDPDDLTNDDLPPELRKRAVEWRVPDEPDGGTAIEDMGPPALQRMDPQEAHVVLGDISSDTDPRHYGWDDPGVGRARSSEHLSPFTGKTVAPQWRGFPKGLPADAIEQPRVGEEPARRRTRLLESAGQTVEQKQAFDALRDEVIQSQQPLYRMLPASSLEGPPTEPLTGDADRGIGGPPPALRPDYSATLAPVLERGALNRDYSGAVPGMGRTPAGGESLGDPMTAAKIIGLPFAGDPLAGAGTFITSAVGEPGAGLVSGALRGADFEAEAQAAGVTPDDNLWDAAGKTGRRMYDTQSIPFVTGAMAALPQVALPASIGKGAPGVRGLGPNELDIAGDAIRKAATEANEALPDTLKLVGGSAEAQRGQVRVPRFGSKLKPGDTGYLTGRAWDVLADEERAAVRAVFPEGTSDDALRDTFNGAPTSLRGGWLGGGRASEAAAPGASARALPTEDEVAANVRGALEVAGELAGGTAVGPTQAALRAASGMNDALPDSLKLVGGSRAAQAGQVPVNPLSEMGKGAGDAVTFTTAKGSEYRVMPDGTTVRNKAPRPEHPGEFGIQPQSKATYYVTPEQADELSLVQAQGGKMTVDAVGDGRIGVRYLDGKDAGKFEKRTVVVPQQTPAKGLLPVEVFDNGFVHFGNPITDVRIPTPPRVPDVGPVGRELPTEEQVEANVRGALERRFPPTDPPADPPVTPVADAPRPETELGFAETLRTSENTSPAVRQVLEANRLTSPGPRNTQEMVDRARARLDAGEVSNMERAIWGTDRLTDDQVTEAQLLISKFGDDGQVARAADLARHVAESLRAEGRAVQAASIWDRLTPEGVLVYANRVIQKAAERGNEGRTSEAIAGTTRRVLTGAARQEREAATAALTDVRKAVSALRGSLTDEGLTAFRDAAQVAGLDKVVQRIDKLRELAKAGRPFNELRQEMKDIAYFTDAEIRLGKRAALSAERDAIKRTKLILRKNDITLPEPLAESLLERAKALRTLGEPAAGTAEAAAKFKAQQDLMADIQSLAPPSQWEPLLNLLNLPRTLLTMADFSAVLRQGAILGAGNPKQALGALGPMVRAFRDPDYARDVDALLRTRPRAATGDSAGLYLAPLDGKLARREENFMSNLAERIPVLGRLAEASEQSYVTYLNKVRADVFDAQLARWDASGYAPTERDLRDYATWVNWATGRGSIGSLANVGPALNVAFFAPRFAASRLQAPIAAARAAYSLAPGGGALPGAYSREVAKVIAKDAAAFLGAGMGALALMNLGGAEIEADPRSSDFGKGRFGPLRIDVWAGEQQVARTLAQLATGEAKSGDRVRDANRLDVLMRWVRSKVSPTAGMVVDQLAGETIVGDKPLKGDDPWGLYLNNAAPLIAESFAEISQQASPAAAVATLPLALLGVGVSAYGGEVEGPKALPGLSDYNNAPESAAELVAQDGRVRERLLEYGRLAGKQGASAEENRKAAQLRADLGADLVRRYNAAVSQIREGLLADNPELLAYMQETKGERLNFDPKKLTPTPTKEPTPPKPTATPNPLAPPRFAPTREPTPTRTPKASPTARPDYYREYQESRR